jgi:hypothetical protein
MSKNSLVRATVTSLALIAGYTGQAQPYSNAVMALNPVAYWPLNETTQPTPFLNLTATNLGMLGATANGSYGAWYQATGNTFYLTNNISQVNAVTFPFDGSKAMNCQRQPGQYVVVPRNTNGVANSSLALNPPFSIEAWLQIGTTGNALGTIVSQGGFVNLNTGGPNPSNPYYGGLGTGWAGVELGQYQDYLFLICNSTNGQSKNNELDTSAYNTFKGFVVGQWVHVVATFDGTNEVIWTNSVLSVQKAISPNAAGVRYVADPTTPLMIGSGSDVSASYGIAYQGAIHDVAIYTNLLSPTSITNHFQTAYGTNATYGSVYPSSVLADTPALYYRLNDAQSITNAGYPVASFPVATNYGSAGAAAAGAYQPGTTPGVAGPPFTGFGASSKSVAINGWLGAVDVGGGSIPAALNPTGTSPLTVAAWFKGGPADAPGRFQEILGHSDSSYRLALGQVAGENHFNPGPGPELQFVTPADVVTNNFALNDGKWHMVVGISDGTNDYMYLDGQLAKSGSNPTGINIVGSSRDLLLGGDPQYTTASPSSANTIRNFDGQIAQVAFWSNALTGPQIQQLYGAAAVPPSIVVQPPASVTSTSGYPVAISVVARGSSLAYQWYRGNGTAVGGQTTASLSFNPVVQANAGTYYAVITNVSGAVTSSVVQLSVIGPPLVQQQSPTTAHVFVGTSPALRVTAEGAPPISYQWTKDGTAISGANNSSYTPDTSVTGTHSYNCIITNLYSTNTPSPFNPISVTVLSDPTAPFPLQVLADHAIDYFRLNEADQGGGNNGLPAYDYAGGLNAAYTNTTLGQPGYTSDFTVQSDPSETSALFGGADSFAGNVSSYLNFAAPNGSSASFSFETWVSAYAQTTNAGIVSLGSGNGGEQFCLDTGGPGFSYRFFVRDAAGVAHGATAAFGPNGGWHHLAAVCDQPNGHIYLYFDGTNIASGTFPANIGMFSSSLPLTIGSRMEGPNTAFDAQFNGAINDVAVYNYALTPTQVLNHYLAAGIAPIITLAPTNTTVNQGATAIFYGGAIGTAPLHYQWSETSTGDLPGQTNANLVLTNVPLSDNGLFYVLTVTNIYGTASSYFAQLTVLEGPPQIVADLQPLFVENYVGTPYSYSVQVQGTAPLHYQWQRNGSNIPGATNSTYSFSTLAGTNYYVLTVTNNVSPYYAISSTGTNVGVPVPTLNPLDYGYKAQISLPGYNRGETLLDFPLLVQFGTNLPGFAYSQMASPTGGDVRFTDASGTRVIWHEVDEWNPAGQSFVWVQLPRLAGTNDPSSTNNYIWAYWGSAANGNPPAYATNGSVWVPQPFEGLPPFRVVYHLKESAFPFEDSTLINPALTGSAAPPNPTPGVVGTGSGFTGTQYLDAGIVTNLDDTFTLSAWINIPNSTANIQSTWANQHGGFGAPGFALFVNSYNNTDQIIDLATGTGTSGGEARTGNGSVGFGAWHLLSAAVDRLNATVQFSVDGVSVPQASGSVAAGFTNIADLRLGMFTDNNFGFHGTMDEARIQAGTNSINWVWASYMTVAANSSFQRYNATLNIAPTLNVHLYGNKLVLSGYGLPGTNYNMLAGTNVTQPQATWTHIASGTFAADGSYSVTNTLNGTQPRQFYRVAIPR